MSRPFRALGLGSGGIKGILHIGALRELAKHQPLEFPDGVYGCSIGSIIGTYLSFRLPLDNLVSFVEKHTSIDSIVPKFSMTHLTRAFSVKGMYDMDTFEQRIVDLFNEHQIPIQTLTIKDAQMPLYIIASNVTRGVPFVFPKEARIVDALKASCCIPGLFRPQEWKGELFVDGAILSPCIASVMSTDTPSLALSLSKQRRHRLTPSSIETISPLDYLLELYTLTTDACHRAQMTDETLSLSYPNLYSDSDLSEFSVPDVLSSAGLQLHRFLFPNILDKEAPESVDTR